MIKLTLQESEWSEGSGFSYTSDIENLFEYAQSELQTLSDDDFKEDIRSWVIENDYSTLAEDFAKDDRDLLFELTDLESSITYGHMWLSEIYC